MSDLREKWGDVPNYEGLYQVSDRGRVKSLKRTVNSGGRNKIRTVREMILKPVKSTSGYYFVNLNKQGHRRQYLIHQLIAMAFLGHKPNGAKWVIDHIDEDKTNNVLSNIRIVTNRENILRGFKNSKSKYPGVDFCKSSNKWRARIQHNYKKYYLGDFDSELDAKRAYEQKKIELLK